MNDSDETGDEAVTVEELIALREGDLSDDQAAALQARVNDSPRAQQLLVELGHTDEVLGVVRNQPVPPELVESIDRLIAEQQQQRNEENSSAEESRGRGDAGSGRSG